MEPDEVVFFNYSTMQMAAKVVYYGPGLCGKTTNLQYIYSHTTNDSRGEMVSLETESDRTLFFDLLPIDVGSIAGFSTRIQLYTVPGQVFYNTTRKLVLKGVDGVVFVADSQRPMVEANAESFRNLEENLGELGLSIENIPLVLQYNKRDLPDVASVDDLNRSINRNNWPYVEASALTGQGVFETLKGISKLTLLSLKKRLAKGATQPPRRPAASPLRRPQSAAAPAAPPRSATVTPPSPEPKPRPELVQPAAVRAASPSTAVPAAERSPGPEVRAATTSPRPATPTPSRAKSKGMGSLDVLAQLEEIRKQALRPKPSRPATPRPAPTRSTRPEPVPLSAAPTPAPQAPAPTASPHRNGSEINRDIRLTLKRDDFLRAHRFLLTLKVEDADQQVVDSLSDFQVELGKVDDLQKVLLRLSIALHAKE